MVPILTLKLPEGASVESGKALETEIKQIDGIKSSGVQQTRGLDAAAITVWFGIASSVMDVVKKIIEVVRGKGLTGVEIHLPTGGVVKIDSASSAEIEKLVKAMGGAS
jgi:hypothetical protein